MNRLRLADPGYLSQANYNLSQPGLLSEFDISEYYLNVPTETGEIIKVREDFLDKYNDAEFNEIMNILEPYQEKTMSGLFSGLRERIKARRDQRTTINPETGMTQRQEYKLKRQSQRGETIGKAIEGIKNIFGKGETPQYKELDIQGGIGLDYNQPSAQGSNTKTALIIGGSALALILLYKMMKKK